MFSKKISELTPKSFVIGRLKLSEDKKIFYLCNSSEQTILHFDSVSLSEFDTDDIVSVSEDGTLTLLYKPEWRDLGLFFTNDCNSRCIMCPQISVEDKGNYLEFNKTLLRLKPKNLEKIGITGGEPTIYKNDFLNLIKFIREVYPNIPIQILTNGRNFADMYFVKELRSASSKKILLCVPIYATTSNQHDEIVGVKNAFNQTIKGIYNLYRFRLLTEIRIVIFSKNHKYLEEIANFIWRNFPFVAHVAFMGMEYTGNASLHKKELWIDPYQFREELDRATWFLHQRNMRISIYNIPFCLLNERSRIFARDSISDWKKKFFPQCKNCIEKQKCSGFFATSACESNFLKPFNKKSPLEVRG